MRKYEVKITSHAKESLHNISQYILKELQAPQAAEKTMVAIRSQIYTLDVMPTRIPITDEEPWRNYGIRRMRVKNFYVYFWIDEDEHRVQVTNVVFVGRDQRKQLEIMPFE